MKDRYSIKNLITGLRHPSLIIGEINDIGWRINAKVHNFVGSSGTNFMQEDWDTLILLDGCRYDLFEREHEQFEGRLESKTSLGSQTWEFLQNNFQNKEFHDTIYVSANPYTVRLDSNIFFRTQHLWDDEWSEEYRTVLPEDVTRCAIEAHEQNPNKRLLVHYMQPHFPFLGPTGKQFSHQGVRRLDDSSDVATALELDRYPVWLNLRYGLTGIDPKTVRAAYRENLGIVLDTLPKLLTEVDGKTVISADHGNLMGERLWPIPVRGYGHPPGLRTEQLIKVPWFICNHSTRRNISSGKKVSEETAEKSAAEDRLKQLGYV